MSKKRRGGESRGPVIVLDEARPDTEVKLTNVRFHFSDGNSDMIRKECQEGVRKEVRGGRIASAPPCIPQSALEPLRRGLKRNAGCIDASTQTGRKNKIEDEYVKGAAIGHGAYGAVCLCKSKATGVEYACKTLGKGVDPVHKEVEIMQHLSGHPGVVTLQGVYEEDDCFHLVMELCCGGRLIDQMAAVRMYTEQRAATALKELMEVVKYCHEMGVVHRDIKPENILLTSSGHIKLADFGLSLRIANGQTLQGKAGSPAYIAPEVLSGEYAEKVDVWSCGVVLHALLVGLLPFPGNSVEEVFESIKTLKLDFHGGSWESISESARDLLERMLNRDVCARITADEVLRHPWIRFHTENSSKLMSYESKSKNRNRRTPSPRCKARRNRAIPSPPRKASVPKHREQKLEAPILRKDSELHSTSMSCDPMVLDEFDIVDVLARAISRVNISEPRKNIQFGFIDKLTTEIPHSNIAGPSSLCMPSTIKQQQYMIPNNLCTAF